MLPPTPQRAGHSTTQSPLDYKFHALHDWALNPALPIPTFYF
ncbi:hypothetical protein C4J88_1821 [Pseudomonas sp. R4-39-08]|nr:hypothetical protein [Pseudomonas sp. R4-39-08]AZF36610.1 hypothetical protein C4J88_1821 [Pseudomonas sp. R4-39-08]